MSLGLFPVAYRAGAIAAGFRSSGAALGIGAAGAAAIASSHPDARGSLANALNQVSAPSAADLGGAVAGAAAGFATQAALTSAGAIARGALGLSPWVLAAFLALELLHRWLKGRDGVTIFPAMFPSNWTMTCGHRGGRLRATAFPCGSNGAYLNTDPNWDKAGTTFCSWHTFNSQITPTTQSWAGVGSATRSVVGPMVPGMPFPLGGQGRRTSPRFPARPEDRGRTSPLARTLDPLATKPGEVGDNAPPMPLPWPLIPAVRPNPFRAPLEQRQRGYSDPSRARARPVVVDAYIPTERAWSRPIVDAIPIPIAPGEQWPGVVVRPPAIVQPFPRRGVASRPLAPGHVFARAKAGTKEVKVKMSIQSGSPAGKMVHLVTETEDFIDALWDSIPEDCKRNIGLNFNNLEDKMKAIYRFMGTDCLPWEAALQNLVVEKTTDMVFGAAGRAQAQANQTFGWVRSPLWMSQLNPST